MLKKDVGMWDDFLTFCQNAIACENHCLISYSISKDEKYLEIATEIRRNRSKWMYKFIKENKEQLYCICKHLMVMATAIKEMAVRFVEDEEKNLAKECLDEANLYENLVIELNQGGK